jgi:hypothetical protein
VPAGKRRWKRLVPSYWAHPTAIAFTLCPLTVRDIIEAADAGPDIAAEIHLDRPESSLRFTDTSTRTPMTAIKILVIGACGQIGTELTTALRDTLRPRIMLSRPISPVCTARRSNVHVLDVLDEFHLRRKRMWRYTEITKSSCGSDAFRHGEQNAYRKGLADSMSGACSTF